MLLEQSAYAAEGCLRFPQEAGDVASEEMADALARDFQCQPVAAVPFNQLSPGRLVARQACVL